jgi:excisionase family DNA binding protein
MPNPPVTDIPGHEPVLLNLVAAASLLAVHPNTVRALVQKGRLPGAKVGRSWRFVEADLVAWIRCGYPEAARVQLSALE